jgi:hypothetical protein
MISNTMTCEMFDDFSGGLGVEKTPVAPPTPMDNPLFAFDKKARDSNRLPAKVLQDAFVGELLGEQIVDDYGNPATLEKSVPSESDDDPEPIELSPELMAKVQEISGYTASASWRLFSSSLTRAVEQPLAKTFCGRGSELAKLDPPEKNKKLLSTRREGRIKVSEYTGGVEVWECAE